MNNKIIELEKYKQDIQNKNNLDNKSIINKIIEKNVPSVASAAAE